MPDAIRIVTNHHTHPIIDGYELTIKERNQFDYIDWAGVIEGTDSASFFRYKGQLYDLHEFETTYGIGAPTAFKGWDGYASDSFFSGTLVRYTDDYESVIVGTYCS
jgi:hypothetical protein